MSETFIRSVDEIKTVAVLGAGTMGHGIAQVAAMSGFQVVMRDLEEDFLAAAVGKIQGNLEKGVARGKVSVQERDWALAALRTTTDIADACRDAQLVIEIDTEFLSISEFLAELVQATPRTSNKKPIYYHDPCHLARYSGVIEEPRLVLARIAELRDFDWSHSDADCCGGAGLLPKTNPDIADGMARRRLREVANRGGGTVVTACATCAYMLRSNAPSGVEVHDLATYVADACKRVARES